jgi:hypothetical protein
LTLAGATWPFGSLDDNLQSSPKLKSTHSLLDATRTDPDSLIPFTKVMN